MMYGDGSVDCGALFPMSPPAASLASWDRYAAASILLSMSHEDAPQPDVETSDDQHNSSDGANASRKGQPWTEEEHLAFLQGLRKLGKGNWRAIAKSFVPSRTPTQVASHAQKHFMRVAGATKRKSRFTALEVQVGTPKQAQLVETDKIAPANQQCLEHQPSGGPQPSSFAGMSTAFPAMPFPFMPPMMVGFPGPFFAPFLCPPPAFAAAALSAMQKQQGHMPMVMPTMFPMAAAMAAAMNPFLMAQHMAAAAQAAAAASAAAAATAVPAAVHAQAATSAGGRGAGTSSPTATTDTATSEDEVPVPPRQHRQSVAPGSPGICKPEAQHFRPGAAAVGIPAAASAPAAASSEAAMEGPSAACGPGGSCSGGGAADSDPRDGPCGAGGPGGSPRGASAASAAARTALTGGTPASASAASGPGGGSCPAGVGATALGRGEDCVGTFHTSSHSAFRPPQELKSEG